MAASDFFNLLGKVKTDTEYSIASICNPLMDFIAAGDEDFLNSYGVKKGSMNLIDEATRNRLLAEPKEWRRLPGGSAANTLRGFCLLNRTQRLPHPIFWGAVGGDALGEEYSHLLRTFGVEAFLTPKRASTGTSFVVFTPDHERTMLTFLGACQLIERDEVDLACVQRAQVLHLTGYLWDVKMQRDLALAAAYEAKSKGVAISFDIADPLVVGRYRSEFLDFIKDYVTILFGNRQEMAILYGESEDKEIVKRAGEHFSGYLLLKVGKEGCWLAKDGQAWLAPGFASQPLDTCGAGDAFAAGFLFSYLEGRDLASCALTGNRLAAKIVEVLGCDYEAIQW